MNISSNFTLEFQRIFGIPFNHAMIQGNEWKVAVWDKSIMPKMIPGKTNDILAKLWAEFENNPLTGIKPKSWDQRWNILHKTGMTHAGQLGTGEIATTWLFTNVGTSNAAENQDHTALTAETGTRKSFASAGQRKVVNQTQNFSMPYFDTDLTVPVTLREAGINTLSAAGVQYCRVVFSDKPVVTGDLFTLQIKVIFVNGIVV